MLFIGEKSLFFITVLTLVEHPCFEGFVQVLWGLHFFAHFSYSPTLYLSLSLFLTLSYLLLFFTYFVHIYCIYITYILFYTLLPLIYILLISLCFSKSSFLILYLVFLFLFYTFYLNYSNKFIVYLIYPARIIIDRQ